MAVPISPVITWFTLWAHVESHRTDLTCDLLLVTRGGFGVLTPWSCFDISYFLFYWLFIKLYLARILVYSTLIFHTIIFTKFSLRKKVCNSLIRVGPNKIGIGKLELFAWITGTNVPKVIFIKILKESYQKILTVLLKNKPTWFTSAISSALDPSFQKDQDILVLPLDLLQLDTHENLAKDVIKHFGKVNRTNYFLK